MVSGPDYSGKLHPGAVYPEGHSTNRLGFRYKAQFEAQSKDRSKGISCVRFNVCFGSFYNAHLKGLKILMILFVSMMAGRAEAQLSLSPKRIVIHEQSRSGELRISNSSDTTQEVTLEIRFGYPVFDREGLLTFVYDDEVIFERAALDHHLSVFPRQFLLAPGNTQVVRLFLNRTFDKPDGTYWTRLEVKAEKQSNTIGTLTEQAGVGTALTFQIDQSVSVYYQKGKTATVLTLSDFEIAESDSVTVLRSKFKRDGNSPFLGKYDVLIRDDDDNVVVSRSGSFYCHFSDWLHTELPAITTLGEDLAVIYRFTPYVFDQRNGNMRASTPFEIKRHIFASKD